VLQNDLITWLFVICVLLFFGVPLAFVAYRRVEQAKRLRLERSKRRIKLQTSAAHAPGEEPAEGCPHKRSKSRAKTGEDGKMRSICRFCGVPMIRNGPGDWEVLAPGETTPPA
jgi:hypothetical protein